MSTASRLVVCALTSLLVSVAIVMTYGALPFSAQQVARPSPEAYSRLQWRHIGPEGNPISAVAGVPGQPLVYYAGSASGGIHKSTDGGSTWGSNLRQPAGAFHRRSGCLSCTTFPSTQ